jgi:hypothetical protein
MSFSQASLRGNSGRPRHFSPVSKDVPMLLALIGGSMIGLAASVAWSGARQIAGIGWTPRCQLDVRLVTGAALFGAGRGMSGYCPGPALEAAAYGRGEAVLFAVTHADRGRSVSRAGAPPTCRVAG